MISAEELFFVLRKLGKHKARGMDSFSNAGIRSMPPDLCAMLLALLNAITTSGEWPLSLCKASVALLSKILVPLTPGDSRPITILSTIYRIWGKIYATKMLKHILPHLPGSVHGSIPGRSALGLAWDLQAAIEQADLSGESIDGVSIDLSKAYNVISREVLELITNHLGWPREVRAAYSDFLSKLQRYFVINGDFSNAAVSSSGVPEGDPVAGIAMVVTTWFVSARLQGNGHPVMQSYVDNWAIQATNPPAVLSAVADVALSVDKIAMILARDKLVFYSNDENHRKILRSSTVEGKLCKVAHDFRDLGVFFCAAQRQSAKLCAVWFQAAQSRFQRLAVLGWSDYIRSKCLVRIILPAVLYGCELSH